MIINPCCIHEDSLISLTNGLSKKIVDMIEGDKLFSWSN
jgi:hypothetical protein